MEYLMYYYLRVLLGNFLKTIGVQPMSPHSTLLDHITTPVFIL